MWERARDDERVEVKMTFFVIIIIIIIIIIILAGMAVV